MTEVRQAIIARIFEWFDHDHVRLLKKFQTKVDAAPDRESALALKESADYLQASPQLSKLMDAYIDKVHPPKARFSTRFWNGITKWAQVCTPALDINSLFLS